MHGIASVASLEYPCASQGTQSWREAMRTIRMKLVVAGLAALVTSISTALAAPAAAYNNPNYPGSTLSLALSGPSVTGQITTIVASGTNTKEEIGGYQLDMYAKVASIDHACAN